MLQWNCSRLQQTADELCGHLSLPSSPLFPPLPLDLDLQTVRSPAYVQLLQFVNSLLTPILMWHPVLGCHMQQHIPFFPSFAKGHNCCSCLNPCHCQYLCQHILINVSESETKQRQLRKSTPSLLSGSPLLWVLTCVSLHWSLIYTRKNDVTEKILDLHSAWACIRLVEQCHEHGLTFMVLYDCCHCTLLRLYEASILNHFTWSNRLINYAWCHHKNIWE